ncbi:hypothetical protein PPL_03653 [Heterostelium album PN500]|uniref:Uncharacterized protein n=1 Tax=Heterostelium pallidum (strain ATCC 26659 / Pp 5 / PN500) TaxID=670386 RepID=D3B6A5_HETP5|nr:hypothetical protein PPL_03653 [Heterostelium album PN500]EFA82875.1 hypothetical protein PPL_03653 [Heterostelium album PN500]|eukprot:XP_020434992.1 hypothetical protein PPL_03653 [Heterostelium album PN500]
MTEPLESKFKLKIRSKSKINLIDNIKNLTIRKKKKNNPTNIEDISFNENTTTNKETPTLPETTTTSNTTQTNNNNVNFTISLNSSGVMEHNNSPSSSSLSKPMKIS